MSQEKCPCCGAKKRTLLNADRDRIIREKYTEGVSLSELSALNFITEARIRQIIGCVNLHSEDKNKSIQLYKSRYERNQEIYHLHKDGHSNKIISDKFNLSVQRTWQIIKKMTRREEIIVSQGAIPQEET